MPSVYFNLMLKRTTDYNTQLMETRFERMQQRKDTWPLACNWATYIKVLNCYEKVNYCISSSSLIFHTSRPYGQRRLILLYWLQLKQMFMNVMHPTLFYRGSRQSAQQNMQITKQYNDNTVMPLNALTVAESSTLQLLFRTSLISYGQ